LGKRSFSVGADGSIIDETLSGDVGYVGAYEPGNKYPVISKVQAGAWAEACEPYTLKDIDLWLESDAHIQGDAFWLEVEGDSMTAPMGLSIPEVLLCFSIQVEKPLTAIWLLQSSSMITKRRLEAGY
jgi:hypothetical protein